ncbi:MAG: YafY family protein [Bacilli bacterium]
MSKSKRLIELMMTVNAKRKFTVRELADEFGVSYRTILRDLQELSELGVPLYSEVGVHGGYSMLNDRVLPPISFLESEAIAMFFAYQSLQFYGSLPFESESKSALKKFYHYLSNDIKEQIDKMKDRIVFWNPFRHQSSVHLKILLEAATKQTNVTIEYDSSDGETKRVVKPVGLYTYNGFWFCPAYCYTRGGFRLFRADRILSAHLSNEPRSEIDISDFSIMDWLNDEEDVGSTVLSVTLTRDGVRRCKTDLWLGNYITIHDDGTGKIATTIPEHKIEYCGEILWGLGTNAIIEQPQELIDYIKNKITTMSTLYP